MAYFIYDNKEIEKYFYELEDHFLIENAEQHYHNLVNFSKNIEVPYHKWFKYREGFAAELIKGLLSLANLEKEDVVIDPFCGSGTTNVVAAFEGYDTFGLDVNPMSAFITNAKLTSYSKEDLSEAKEKCDLAIKNTNRLTSINEDIKKYFPSDNFYDLMSIKSFIDALDNNKAKQILSTAFLSIIIESSNRKRDGNGLKKVNCKVSDVKKVFADQVCEIINDISSNPICSNVKGVGMFGSALDLKELFDAEFYDRNAGAIIFSPPYANSFDYFESYKLELVLGGYSNGITGIKEFRKKAVRSFVGADKALECDYYVDLISKEIMSAIPLKENETGKKDSRTRKVPDMLRGYFSDMKVVIQNCAECLKPGKKLFIVVDQSAYLGKIVPTDLIFAMYGEQLGFKVNRIIECRKARTSTQQLYKYPYLKDALRESILELEKE